MSFILIFENKKQERELENEIKIKDLLDELDVFPETTIVKQNGEIAEDDSQINDGDEIHVLQIVYGG